jgi:hypothetical protein
MGTGAGTGYPSLLGASETLMQPVEAISERILYLRSLNTQVRALAERLLQRFAVTVSDLPASAAHHDASTAAYIGIRSKSRSRLRRLSPLWLFVGAKDGTVSQLRAVWRKAWGCGR